MFLILGLSIKYIKKQGFYSIVLLAVCDASYRFTYLDVGAYGSEGDANIFTQSKFGKEVTLEKLDFPENKEVKLYFFVNCFSFKQITLLLQVNGKQMPYFLLGDEAFPLCKRIMKPFNPRKASKEEKLFNYRLSRARRCIENSFGLLSSKWMCLQRTMYCYPDKAQKIISACCLLHNFLLRNDRDAYQHTGERNEIGASTQLTVLPSYSGRSSDFAKQMRNELKMYFCSENGSVSWQNESAFVQNI